MYDFTFSSGEIPLANFTQTNPFSLSKDEIQVYQDLLDNYFGLFEVLSVLPMKGMSLKLLSNQMEFFVEEFSGSLDAQKGFGIFARVSKSEIIMRWSDQIHSRYHFMIRALSHIWSVF